MHGEPDSGKARSTLENAANARRKRDAFARDGETRLARQQEQLLAVLEIDRLGHVVELRSVGADRQKWKKKKAKQGKARLEIEMMFMLATNVLQSKQESDFRI